MESDGEICVATIERSKTSDIRVRLVEFGGRSFVDLRTFRWLTLLSGGGRK